LEPPTGCDPIRGKTYTFERFLHEKIPKQNGGLTYSVSEVRVSEGDEDGVNLKGTQSRGFTRAFRYKFFTDQIMIEK
jgi:hypothetical protein